MRARALLVVTCAIAGCDGAGSSASTPPTDPGAHTPAAAFERLERRMLGAARLTITCDITSTGEHPAQVHVELAIGPGEELRERVTGTFEGAAVDLELHADASTQTLRCNDLVSPSDDARVPNGSSDPRAFADAAMPRAPALKEALLLGMTRMGLLHNVAVMSAGQHPDFADGAFTTTVTTTSHDWHYPALNAPPDGHHFDIVFAGTPVGTADLTLDPTTLLPATRTQLVHFPTGDMHVTEQCSVITP